MTARESAASRGYYRFNLQSATCNALPTEPEPGGGDAQQGQTSDTEDCLAGAAAKQLSRLAKPVRAVVVALVDPEQELIADVIGPPRRPDDRRGRFDMLHLGRSRDLHHRNRLRRRTFRRRLVALGGIV